MSCKKLEIRNLTVELETPPRRRLIDRLSLTVPGGQALAVIGESGAGKSMTSLAVMGLLPPGIRQTGGEIRVNERTLSELSREGRRRMRNREVAMIMQNPMSAFDPVFTIGGHFHETSVSHFPGCHGREIHSRAVSALAEVGFEEPEAVLGVYPFQMSGGMLQRVMIALALLTDPDFLIADEATTDLDMVAQAQILSLLKERRRVRHLGLVVITHDLAVAAYLADTVAVMRKGELVETGRASDIFANPSHPYTRELLAAHRDLYVNSQGGQANRRPVPL